MIHVDSYHNESRTSACIAYAGSTRANVQRAIDIEAGARAVRHYERMGLIQFPDKDKGKSETRADTIKMTNKQRITILKDISKRMKAGERIGDLSKEHRVAVCTVRGWSRTFGIDIPRTNRSTPTDEEFGTFIRLVNEGGLSLSKAAREIGRQQATMSVIARKRGYAYDAATKTLIPK